MKIYDLLGINLKDEDGNISEDVSFSVSQGEVVSIYSPFGEARPLLNLLYLRNFSNAGKILYVGQDVSTFSRKDIIEYRVSDCVYIDSSETLFSGLTVKDNIFLPLILNRKKIDFSYLSSLYEVFGFESILNKPLSTQTKTIYILTKILRAMTLKPFVLLLDDLTVNLSPKEKEDVLNVIIKINDIYKTTIIMHTTSLFVVKYGSKRLYYQDGNLSEITND